ncbi:Peptidoglycan-N-acetylglucosamine deacetylase [Actinomadura rubteroloni]|uniref:Peptidoglycan-N-acetylglucosamine deacetylase n=1 Tax=Actinomadura rubteroloni TaxID=1926885 RepID=A0A2P4UNX4_9ACTN|nr:polysaccharide deacetylase family protein [Actinomadura rubteroloni]POM26732.1 Peptidoglycan-N-acetylglucosamine deacetylase [Actinomadura rubteroloni]
MSCLVRPAGLGAAVVLAAHLGPAVTCLRSVRRWTPRTAGRGDPGHVALTFDDGPDGTSTPRFLDALAELDCRATFFVLGDPLRRRPDLGRRMVAEGHEIAVHGWRHQNGLLSRPGRVSAGIARTVRLVRDVCGVRPVWYRPPHGALSGEGLAAARAFRLRPVLWTAWGRDWTATTTPGTVRATLDRDLRGGATVLLHDSDVTSAPGAWRATLDALPGIVAACRAGGLAVGPLRDHGIHPRTHGFPDIPMLGRNTAH